MPGEEWHTLCVALCHGTAAIGIEPGEAERRQLTVMSAIWWARPLSRLVSIRKICARSLPLIMRLAPASCRPMTASSPNCWATGSWPISAIPAHTKTIDIIAAVARLKTRAAEPLAVRIGIATGLVVVGDLSGGGLFSLVDVHPRALDRSPRSLLGPC
jgi:hypothetical protein